MTALQKHLAFHNKEGELNFDAPTHVYTNEENKVYTSVTQLLEKFSPKFDKEFWGMYTALKDNGLKVKPDLDNRAIVVSGKHLPLKSLLVDGIYKHWYAATLAKWEGINAEAIHRGNNTHDYLESTVNKSKGFVNGVSGDNYQLRPEGYKGASITTIHDLDQTDLKDRFPVIYERLTKFIERDCIIYAEKRLRLDLAQIAGMIDLPIVKRGTNKFCILDWKTNKEKFYPTAGYMKKIKVGDKWIKSETFVPTDDRFSYPIGNVPYCKIMTYALQLSIYAYMMEVWGYELVANGLQIVHIRPGEEPEVLNLPYLRDEVELLIRHRLEELGIPFFDKTNIEANYNYGK